MVNRINVKLLFVTVGLVLALAGVYMNTITVVDFDNRKLVKIAGEEVPAFLVAIGIALSLTGVAIPIPSERGPALVGAPQATTYREGVEERSKVSEIEFLCPKCGAPVSSSMIFCINCGRRIKPESSTRT
ncbi:MAG: zinc ribbon domain-containing protein [Candidatus Brockarchaeota archaeon]|nr:zinc ribbon domain-containing protein [Candidatus Brockarchaeota archaeon]